jgi:hypothetical protein
VDIGVVRQNFGLQLNHLISLIRTITVAR